MEKNKVKKVVSDFYTKVASNGGMGCNCKNKQQNRQIAKEIGYTDAELKNAGVANLGLGCGNPTALAHIEDGDTVLDLGSGAGFDCLLVASKVGVSGHVIGIDMVPQMIDLARKNVEDQGFRNVEFKLGDIENLPIEDESIDVVISNCVINLAPNKSKVFSEIHRVLKNGGRMYVSDIVLLDNLTKEQKSDENLLAGCVGGALLKDEYIKLITDAGFSLDILSENKEISKTQYKGVALESLKVEAKKV